MQQSTLGNNSKINTVLQVSASKKQLSKNQQTFNRLTKRIAKLREELATDGIMLTQLSNIYNKEITPLLTGLANEKIVLAKKLADASSKITLSEKQTSEVGQLIFDLLDDAFVLVTPDAEAKKLYDSLARVSYDEGVLEEKEAAREDLKEHISNVFGIDIDMDNFDASPDGYAQFKEKLRQRIEEKQAEQKKKQKTKKQLAKEASVLEQEAVKKRSMRSIYMSLVKLLHPDTETDETVKLQKEEIMKELTTAYNDNNLTALLQLELQWIARENDHLEKLSDDTLKIYISVLNGQVKELETEKAMQENNPAFAPVRQYMYLNLNTAMASIHREKNAWVEFIEQMRYHTKTLGIGKLRAAIRDCIRAYSNTGAGYDANQPSFSEIMETHMRRQH